MLSDALLQACLLETEIEPEDLKEFLQDGESIYLLDVRSEDENKICQIEGSFNVPLTILAQHLDQIPKDRLVITICHHGVRSLNAAMILKQQNFPYVLSLKGGVHAWALYVDNTMTKY